MMYRTETKPDRVEKLEKLRREFMNIYEKHDVDIMGYWQDRERPHVSYYMARYEDEDQYTETVQKLKEDKKYSELTDKLNEIRTDFEATRLTPL
jgi:tRNA-dihydrouridine synthase